MVCAVDPPQGRPHRKGNHFPRQTEHLVHKNIKNELVINISDVR
jgi:hypothetical protein